ncbi:flagellar basal body P-ring formation protein FlgA [bacterium]|nr:flagellar basal body P-ring formation protein FlgA [bacterium]
MVSLLSKTHSDFMTRSWALPCLLIGGLMTAGVIGTADAALIDIRGQVTAGDQTVIQLQHIATISDPDPAVVEKLGSIMLCPAPATGRSLRITYDQVRDRLQAQGVNLVSHELRGASSTEVRSPALTPVTIRTPPVPISVRPVSAPNTVVRVGPKDLAKANEIVKTAFRRAFRTEALEARGITVVCSVSEPDVASLIAIDASQVRFRNASLQVGSPQTLTACWTDPQGDQQEATVEVLLEQAALALALKASLPAGAIIRPEDLGWMAAEEGKPGLSRLADVVGKEARRSLAAGHRLTDSDLTSVPLIKANDLVTVLVKRPGVTVSRRFKALSTGAMGETVNLVAVDDPRLRVQATVTRYHEAVITDTTSQPVPQRIQDGTGTIEFLPPGLSESGGTTR